MTVRSLLFSAALVIATAAITSTVVSQQDHGQKPPTKEELEMHAKWEAFMTPNENHKILDHKVGKWEGAVKMWMDPNAPPTESASKSEYKWILDGRYLTDTTEGEFMGTPFQGRGLSGYDNIKKKYFWVWVDNMGTGIMVGEGSYDAKTKSFNFTHESPDVMTGKYVKGRSVERMVDNDTLVFEMYGPGPDGKEFKMMEMTYKRVK